MKAASLKTIEITIAPDGQTRVETKGFQGSECREASRLIEQALGRQAAEQLTAEFYTARVTNDAHERQTG